MKKHNCLLCKYSDNFQKPVSVTTAPKLQFAFTCSSPNKKYFETSMWYDLMTDDAWIDGDVTIPKKGCSDFEIVDYVNSSICS